MRATARKATLAVAATALALGTLAGCGGGDSGSSAPDDASKDDFCEAFGTLFTEIMAQVTATDPSDALAAIKDWADTMQEVGTPEDMPDDVREGFEIFIDAAQDLPDDATLDDLENLGDDLSESDQDAGEAFGDWATEECPDALLGGLGELASDLPTDLPTELPSELESMMSEMPTELPSELESMMSEMPTDPAELESMLSELTASMGS